MSVYFAAATVILFSLKFHQEKTQMVQMAQMAYDLWNIQKNVYYFFFSLENQAFQIENSSRSNDKTYKE